MYEKTILKKSKGYFLLVGKSYIFLETDLTRKSKSVVDAFIEATAKLQGYKATDIEFCLADKRIRDEFRKLISSCNYQLEKYSYEDDEEVCQIIYNKNCHLPCKENLIII